MKKIISIMSLLLCMNLVAGKTKNAQNEPPGPTRAQMESPTVVGQLQNVLLERLREGQSLSADDRETIRLIQTLGSQPQNQPIHITNQMPSQQSQLFDAWHFLHTTGDIASVVSLLCCFKQYIPCIR